MKKIKEIHFKYAKIEENKKHKQDEENNKNNEKIDNHAKNENIGHGNDNSNIDNKNNENNKNKDNIDYGSWFLNFLFDPIFSFNNLEVYKDVKEPLLWLCSQYLYHTKIANGQPYG